MTETVEASSPISLALPKRAIFLALAIGVMIICLAIGDMMTIRDDNWREAESAQQDLVASVSHDLERNFEIYSLSLQAVVDGLRAPGVLDLPPESLAQVLFNHSINAPYLGSIEVLDSYGNVFIDSGHAVPERRNFADYPFFQHHKVTHDESMFIGHPYKAPDTGHFLVTLSRRLEFADGSFSGVVVGTIDIEYFKETFSRVLRGENSGMSLLLTDGTIITRFPYKDVDVGRSAKGLRVFERANAIDSGTFITTPSSVPEERLFVSQHLRDLPLILLAARPTASIQSAWRKEALGVAVITVLLLGASGFLAWILTRELKRRAQAEASLFRESQRLRVTLASMGDAVICTDREGRIEYMNQIAEEMTGWSLSDAIGRPSSEVVLIEAREISGVDPHHRALATSHPDGNVKESVLYDKEGVPRAIEDSSAPIRDGAGAVVGAVAILHDVGRTREIADRMTHLAQHDMLTDLPNRVLLRDRLAQAIDRAQRNGEKVAVLFADLDRFKHVNDSLGHSIGDQLLIKVARRLKDCVRAADTVSRQGGDEFVILIADHHDARGPTRVAEKIIAALRNPINVDGNSLTISASVGIAIFPEDGQSAEELIKNADAAMYLAKQSERNTYRFFTAALGEQAHLRLRFEQEIVDGLKQGQFLLHYQPQFDAAHGNLIGVEALVRWNKNGRLVSPAEFISFAEECGQIVALGDRILELACGQLRNWSEIGGTPFCVAVNISAHQLRSAGFASRAIRIIRDAGVDPRRLEFEITESAILDGGSRTRESFDAFRALGIGIALDDFGTGYSSLSSLKGFPITRIKIDRSFVQNVDTSSGDRAIIRAVINMADSFGLRTIAEGVETGPQMRELLELGCDEVQGFLMGWPVPANDITDFVQLGKPLPSNSQKMADLAAPPLLLQA